MSEVKILSTHGPIALQFTTFTNHKNKWPVILIDFIARQAISSLLVYYVRTECQFGQYIRYGSFECADWQTTLVTSSYVPSDILTSCTDLPKYHLIFFL